MKCYVIKKSKVCRILHCALAGVVTTYGAELKYTTFSIINCTVHSQKHVQEQILHNG